MAKKSKQNTGKKNTSSKNRKASVKKNRSSAGGQAKRQRRSPSKSSKKNAPSKSSSPGGSSRTISRPQSRLTPEDVNHFRELLLEKLKEIVGDVHWLENQGLPNSRQDAAGDLSTMPIHMADIGTDTYEQEFSLGLMDSERRLVREILDALKRIERGTYGICEGTGQPIPKGRLEANPWARYCIEYASLLEQGKVIEHRSTGSLRFADGLEEDLEEEEEETSGLEEEIEEEPPAEETDADIGFEEEDLEEDESYF